MPLHSIPKCRIRITKRISNQKRRRIIYCSCSARSGAERKYSQRLGLPLEEYCSQSEFGGNVVEKSKGKCFVNVKSRISDFKIKISAIVAHKIANFLPSQPFEIENYKSIQNLKLADPKFCNTAAIDVIKGSDVLLVIKLEGVRRNISGDLEARESHFGWYLSDQSKPSEINVFSTTVSPSEDMLLHDEIKKFWDFEEVEKDFIANEADIYVETIFQNTNARQSDGRYVEHFPFKENFPQETYLGHSRNSALAHNHRMEKNSRKIS